MTETPTPAMEEEGRIPPFDERARYGDASWTDAWKIAVQAVRSDDIWPGKVETIAANGEDWRFALILHGDPERGIQRLDIKSPNIELLKQQTIIAFSGFARKRSYETPVALWGRYRFPATQEFHEHLLWLISNAIAASRALGEVHQCTLFSLDGEQVVLVDKPAEGHTPVVDMAHALSNRRDLIRRLTHNYVTYVRSAQSDGAIEQLIGEFQAKIDEAAAVGV